MNEGFGTEIASRGVMLVQGVDRNTISGSPRGFREGIAKHILRGIGHSYPVDSAQDDRLSGSKNGEPSTAQGDLVVFPNEIVGQFRANRWGGIHIERGNAYLGCGY
jgi:hypothetical protein